MQTNWWGGGGWLKNMPNMQNPRPTYKTKFATLLHFSGNVLVPLELTVTFIRISFTWVKLYKPTDVDEGFIVTRKTPLISGRDIFKSIAAHRLPFGIYWGKRLWQGNATVTGKCNQTPAGKHYGKRVKLTPAYSLFRDVVSRTGLENSIVGLSTLPQPRKAPLLLDFSLQSFEPPTKPTWELFSVNSSSAPSGNLPNICPGKGRGEVEALHKLLWWWNSGSKIMPEGSQRASWEIFIEARSPRH